MGNKQSTNNSSGIPKEDLNHESNNSSSADKEDNYTNDSNTNKILSKVKKSGKKKEFPRSIHSKKVVGFTELLRCIHNQKWAKARLRVLSNMQEASLWYVEKVVDGSDAILDRTLPLHHACELNAPEELIHALLTAFLDGVKLKDYGNSWLPLHFCCASVDSVVNARHNLNAIIMLLGAYEEGSQVKDLLGRLPIHIACENGASRHIIELLLSAYPASIRMKDKQGRIPLHCACMSNTIDVDVIQTLLLAHPNSVTLKDYQGKLAEEYLQNETCAHPNKMVILNVLRRDSNYWQESQNRRVFQQSNQTVEDENKTELYRLIERKQWAQVIEQARQHPIEARKWFVLRNSDDNKGKMTTLAGNTNGSVAYNSVKGKSCWWRQLPIHELCKLQPPTAVMDAVLEAYPEGAQTVDHYSILPIHLACWGQAGAGVVSCLIKAYPEGVLIKDEKGMLPLHSACWGSASEKVINLLIKAYPQSIEETDNYGRTPLDIINELDQENPAKEVIVASLTSRRGKSQLYRLIENSEWESVLELLKSPKEYLDVRKEDNLASIPYIVKDAYGAVLSCKLPLHLACQMNTPVEVMEELLRSYPLAAFYKGNGDSLPIHFACANGLSVDVIELLLRAHPLSVYEKDIDGNDPIFYARESSCVHKGVTLSMLQKDPSYWKAPKMLPEPALSESTNRSELISLIKEKNWKKSIARCSEFPDEAKVMHVLKDDEGRTICRGLPLHQACQLNPPLSVIESLVDAYKDSPKIRDSFGDLPLHIACDRRASPSVLQYLMKSHPLSILELDSNERNIMTILQQAKHSDYQEIIEMMVKLTQTLNNNEESSAQKQTKRGSQNRDILLNDIANNVVQDWIHEDDKSGYGDWLSVDKFSTISQSYDGERRNSHLSFYSHISADSYSAVDSYAPLNAKQRSRAGRRRSSRIGIPLE